MKSEKKYIKNSKKNHIFTYGASVAQILNIQTTSLTGLLLTQLPLEFNQNTNFNPNKKGKESTFNYSKLDSRKISLWRPQK